MNLKCLFGKHKASTEVKIFCEDNSYKEKTGCIAHSYGIDIIGMVNYFKRQVTRCINCNCDIQVFYDAFKSKIIIKPL